MCLNFVHYVTLFDVAANGAASFVTIRYGTIEINLHASDVVESSIAIVDKDYFWRVLPGISIDSLFYQ